MVLYLRCGGYGIGLDLPATADEVAVRLSRLKEGLDGAVTIDGVGSPIRNLGQYVKQADPESMEDIQKLNALAGRIDDMTEHERQIFSGALDAESVGGLDDVLRVSDSLNSYLFIPNVTSDVELGKYIAVSGQINADPRFPEELWPYLDFAKIGAEYYANRGGAYSPFGYVCRKSSMAQTSENRTTQITVHLRTLEIDETRAKHCCLSLPAADEELDNVKAEMDIDCFADAFITKIEFAESCLEALIPQDGFCVEDANELALAVEELQRTDGELLKFCSVLEVEQPHTFQAAVGLARRLDDYERIIEGTYEYGQSVLRRIGADDEVINTIDGYMDFERFGEAMMDEDGVRQTEFGLVRRLSEPLSSQQMEQTFQ